MTKTNKEWYKQTFGVLHTSRDFSMEVMMRTNTTQSKTKRWIAVASMVALLSVGSGTALAARHFHLMDYFPGTRDKGTEIQTELAVDEVDSHIPLLAELQGMEQVWSERPELPDASPLLDIQEALIDTEANVLYIYASPTENGSQYSLNTDRIYIDGTEYGPVNTDHREDTDGYTFELSLKDVPVNDSLEIGLPLSVYEYNEEIAPDIAISKEEAAIWEQGDEAMFLRYQDQLLTFTVSKAAE